jgi:probable F420-dependent oxidoreductase
MLLGASLPVGDVGTGPAVVKDYAQTLEGLGFDYIQAPDHVLGGNPQGHRDGPSKGTTQVAYHDPFVLFSFIAGCTERIGFSPGVLILAQRQAVLVAKQAASLDELSDGRLRLGIGVGWNELEFTGLNENFKNRGKRSEEQVQVMQALWANPHVDFNGKYHTIDDSGINPRPKSGRVPVWFGGHVDATLQRAAKWGDGWMPLAYAPDDSALKAFDRLRELTVAAGREPDDVGIEVWVSIGDGGPDQWRKEVAFWKKAGVTHITAHTTYDTGHHQRIAGRSAAEHLGAIKQFQDAVRDLL